MYIQKEPSLSANAHYDVTDFPEKLSCMSQGQNMTFQCSKKHLNLSMKKNILRKHNFLVEVTFEG